MTDKYFPMAAEQLCAAGCRRKSGVCELAHRILSGTLLAIGLVVMTGTQRH